MKRKPIRVLLIVIVLALVGIQLIPVDRSNPVSNPQEAFTAHATITPEAQLLLKNACYDCHSNTTTYPWYSYVAPVSFLVVDHIKEGREELNFSRWATYSPKKQAHKLEESIEALREGWMPLEGYVALHKEAKLTTQQRDMLATELEAVMKNMTSAKTEKNTHEGGHVTEAHDAGHDDAHGHD